MEADIGRARGAVRDGHRDGAGEHRAGYDERQLISQRDGATHGERRADTGDVVAGTRFGSKVFIGIPRMTLAGFVITTPPLA